jgi:hypothetical protein
MDVMRFNPDRMAWEPNTATATELEQDRQSDNRQILTFQEYELLREYEEPFEQISWEEFHAMGGQPATAGNPSELMFTGAPEGHQEDQ